MNLEQEMFFTIPPEDDRIPDERMMVQMLCRLTYMLINEMDDSEDQKKEYLDFVDEVVEGLQNLDK